MSCLCRKFGYVEFSSEEDMQKALELNGKKFMGQELKLDRAKSKETSQDGKKGKNTNIFKMDVLKCLPCYTLHFLTHVWLFSTTV